MLIIVVVFISYIVVVHINIIIIAIIITYIFITYILIYVVVVVATLMVVSALVYLLLQKSKIPFVRSFARTTLLFIVTFACHWLSRAVSLFIHKMHRKSTVEWRFLSRTRF